ncbi:MAG: 3-hydroxyacyl-CoA dehydrogenase NAD-binding domain-containing protein [Candidatus Eremiobacteraeota bacterium]|nr:3-hydroxyacyl-CoA dehydrogenase NAD-binding domain-containing protein [Candidatus Eremiobacteraeota bacterium]
MDKVVVVGAGAMGAGIALSIASTGCSVDLVDVNEVVRERAKDLLRNNALRSGCQEATGSIRLLESIAQSAPAVLAIEAVTERLDIKRTVFAQLAAHLGPAAILATNTSSLSVTALANSVPRPERVIGLHFFNPPLLMKLVEIVRTEKTDPAVLEFASSFVAGLRKTGVVTGDTPGFIVNRVARPFYLQAMRALQDGIATIEDMDALARGIGFRMGPFELMDLIGLDINLATSESIYERTGLQRLAPAQMQKEMVAQKKLGRKTKAGFYNYGQDDERRSSRAQGQLSEEAREKSDDERIAVVLDGDRGREYHDAAAGGYLRVIRFKSDAHVSGFEANTSLVIDVPRYDDVHRLDVWRDLDAALPKGAIVLVDAYAGDFSGLVRGVSNPQRFVGYGVIGSLERQSVVEIINTQWSSGNALRRAENAFLRIGKQTRRVADEPGFYLGATVCSIINEAAHALSEGVAARGDIDTAMQLGTNYPKGPFAWAREIGVGRVRRILADLATIKGSHYASTPLLATLRVTE